MYKIHMEVSNPYDIYVENGILDKADSYIKDIYNGKNVYIISDERVAGFYLDKLVKALPSFNVKTVVIEGYEKNKTILGYEEILDGLFEAGITRGELLIALGGGVIGDMVGFVASTLYRGLPYVQIPTSLLSQVDSSIGGKTAIDYKGHKNSVGCFKQPKLVLIDPTTLKTLPERELKNGLGEAIKHAFIGSKKLYSLLENKSEINEEFIYENLLTKKHFVEADEYDTSERMKLNFGHTFGHAAELKEEDLIHGEAVASGMLMATKFAENLGMKNDDIYNKLLNIYEAYGINYRNLDYKDYLAEIHYDKKNIKGTVSFIFVNEIGNAIIKKVGESEL